MMIEVICMQIATIAVGLWYMRRVDAEVAELKRKASACEERLLQLVSGEPEPLGRAEIVVTGPAESGGAPPTPLPRAFLWRRKRSDRS